MCKQNHNYNNIQKQLLEHIWIFSFSKSFYHLLLKTLKINDSIFTSYLYVIVLESTFVIF